MLHGRNPTEISTITRRACQPPIQLSSSLPRLQLVEGSAAAKSEGFDCQPVSSKVPRHAANWQNEPLVSWRFRPASPEYSASVRVQLLAQGRARSEPPPDIFVAVPASRF